MATSDSNFEMLDVSMIPKKIRAVKGSSELNYHYNMGV